MQPHCAWQNRGKEKQPCNSWRPWPERRLRDGLAAYHLAALYAGRREWADAERWVEVALERAPLLPEAHYLHALLLQEAGRQLAAIAALRRCIYADTNFVLAHFTLANLYAQQADTRRAAREWAVVLELLADRPQEEVLPGGDGLTVGRLRGATVQFAPVAANTL